MKNKHKSGEKNKQTIQTEKIPYTRKTKSSQYQTLAG